MRKLILISNPGSVEEGNYQPVTESVINRYVAFFRSNIGGKWSDEEQEIEQYGENHELTIAHMDEIMEELDSSECTYSMIVFCGHGAEADNGEDGIQLPRINHANLNCYRVSRLLSLHEPDEVRRRIKRTVIIDACREILPIPPVQLFEGELQTEIALMDGTRCKSHYNWLIDQDYPHVELLQSTSPDKPAYPTLSGSEYADQVFKLIHNYARAWRAFAIQNIQNGLFEFSMRNLHDYVTIGIARTSQRQIPQYTVVGSIRHGFPFAAISSRAVLWG